MSRNLSHADYSATSLAARVAVIFMLQGKNRQPRAEDLMTRFCISRATAYRHMATARDALGWPVFVGRFGRERAEGAGVEPRFEQFTGPSAVGLVQSCCMHRSLNATQRAMVAAGFLEYERELARLRQIALAGTRHPDLQEDLPEGSKGQARDKAGERMGVSDGPQ